MIFMLSIVIPTKNEEAYLPILLRSIQRQTMQPKEIIVADAFSEDATRHIASLFGCQVVDGDMPGPGRNAGARVATGEFLLFLDADVELQDPFFLEKALANLQKQQFDFATCDVYPISTRLVDHLFHRCYNTYVRLCRPLMAHAPGFCLFARRSLHEEMGGFDATVTFCEDHDYANRCRQYGSFGYLDESLTIPVSTRRFDRDGRLQIAAKYLLGELHLMTLGPIRHHRIPYEFGHCGKKKQKSFVSSLKEKVLG